MADLTGRRQADADGRRLREAADHAKTSLGWRYREIDTDHMILANRPAELVALLLELT